jgi:hypothetical protein
VLAPSDNFGMVETPVTLSCPNVPTEVSDELVTPLPKVLLERTSVPLTL